MTTATVTQVTTADPEPEPVDSVGTPAVESNSDSQTLGEQHAHSESYDTQASDGVVNNSYIVTPSVVSTNSQGNLQQTGGCLLEGNVTSMRPEGNLTHLGEAQHYVQTMQYHQHASGDASDLDQRLQQPMQNVTSSNANVFIADSQVP